MSAFPLQSSIIHEASERPSCSTNSHVSVRLDVVNCSKMYRSSTCDAILESEVHTYLRKKTCFFALCLNRSISWIAFGNGRSAALWTEDQRNSRSCLPSPSREDLYFIETKRNMFCHSHPLLKNGVKITSCYFSEHLHSPLQWPL